MVTVVHVTNPLQPSVGRATHALEYQPGRHLGWYMRRALTTVDASLDPFTVSVNGHIIDRQHWDTHVPADGDFIVVSPLVAGGSLIRTLASVAVLAAAAFVTYGLSSVGSVGAFFAMAGLGNLGATSVSLIASAVTLGGNLLVGALLGNKPSAGNDSATYDPDGPKSLAQSGTVIPKGYGTMNWGGNIIASFVDVEGEDQYINVLACYGFGPARSISQIQINKKDIGTYQNVQYYVRLGTNNQTPMPNFNRIVNGYPQDVQCLAGQAVVVPGTGTLTQALQVDIMFPDGVWVQTKDGNTIPCTVTYLVQYSVAGENNWQPVLTPRTTSDVVSYNPDGTVASAPAWVAVATDLPQNSGVVYATSNGSHNAGDPYSATENVYAYAPDGSSTTVSKVCNGEWQPCDTSLNQVLVSDWNAGYVYFSAADRNPLYNRTSIYGLAAGKYDVQVIKYGSNRTGDSIGFGDNNSPLIGQQVWIHSVNEITLQDFAYPNMILVGIRALATNQLSGASVSVTATIQHGLRTKDCNILPTALQAYEEDNPACCTADAMLDRLYGGGQWPGVVAANINRFQDEWIAWCELNDQLVDDGNGGSIRRHVFNGVFDSPGSLWDAITTIGRMSRACPIPLGMDYGVFIDQPDTPVQMFSMGNIIKESFTETWLDIDSRANQVEITFADATRYWKTDNPLVYMDPANQDSGAIIKNVRIDGKGVTIPAQAWHLCRFKERNTEFLLRSGSFNCDVDAIACRPGNVIILQHDVPAWGWGGRTLPNSSDTAVFVDRADLPFVSGTSYSLVVMFPSLQRYTGTIGAASPLLDGTGASLGVTLTLSSFDNTQRVTRCVVVVAGTSYDSPIASSAAGSIVIQPCAGYTPAAGQTYTLFDTDVPQAAPAEAVDPAHGSNRQAATTVALSAALPQAPNDFSVYFYGPVGSQKLARVVNITRQSDSRAKIEWIDYNPQVYVDATPVIGETSAAQTSNPGVTSLKGSEFLQLISGEYTGYAQLTWQPGPDTVGVGIYGFIVGGNNSQPGGLPRMLARLTGNPRSWQMQIDAGQTWTFIVVGFDINDNYAAFKTAPTVTITFDGIVSNLILDSNFASGFTYWNLTPRVQSGSTQDALVPTLADDGQATYTVAGAALTAALPVLNQPIVASKWAVGEYLMLSAYFADSCVSSSAPNVGNLVASILFLNSSGTQIGSAACSAAMHGVAPNLIRVNTAATLVPAGTSGITVTVGIGAPSSGSLSVTVGSVLTFSHLLLEVCAASTQTVPSEWADLDPAGNVLDLFTTGSSTGLRVQGSTLPTFTGQFTLTPSGTSVLIAWSNLVIAWPDGAYTTIQNAETTISSLALSTSYYAYPYFDIVNGGVRFVSPPAAVSPVGSPAWCTAAYDANSDAATRQDGRVALAPGGLTFTTTSGSTGSSGSGGGPPIPPGGHPISPYSG